MLCDGLSRTIDASVLARHRYSTRIVKRNSVLSRNWTVRRTGLDPLREIALVPSSEEGFSQRRRDPQRHWPGKNL